MFTGIVETTGTLGSRARRGPGFRLDVKTSLGPLDLGESIAVSGACLTVAAVAKGGFEADVSAETAERTTLGRVPPGGSLNLERSVRAGDRLGGHLVTGHVDATARVVEIAPLGEAKQLTFELPAPLARFVAEKGSVALDGVSLTVNRVQGSRFDVVLIPHTLSVTTLGALAVGDELNVEVDLVARYVARLLEPLGRAGHDANLEGALRRAGLLQ